MVFSDIRAFLLNPLKIDDMNHVLSELVLQKKLCIASLHVALHHTICITTTCECIMT
jgi:hypothetical protein